MNDSVGNSGSQTNLVRRSNDPELRKLCEEVSQLAQSVPPQEWPVRRIQKCAESGVFRWFIPEQFGGFGWTAGETSEGFFQLSAACLTTTFALTQLTGACRRIANCGNEGLKTAVLESLASGKALATLGISHLTTSRRHLTEPALVAHQQGDAYELTGFSPWVTGAAHVEGLLTGAELPDGRQLLAHVPMTAKGVSVEPAAKLVALEGSQTGKVRFDRVIVQPDALLGEPVENVMKSGIGASTGGLQTSTLALGLASAAIGYVQAESEKRPELSDASHQLQADLDQNLSTLRTLASGAQAESACSPADLRVNSNSLVLRSTQAAMVAAKGAGFVQGHIAGRWCQEALFFLVWSCPQPVLSANLCELARIE